MEIVSQRIRALRESVGLCLSYNLLRMREPSISMIL